MGLFEELKRRNVIRVGIAYALVAWVVLQIVDFLVELIGAPGWVLQVFFIAAAVGLLAVVIFSWVFEMTPEGLKREREVDRSTSITPETGRKLDRVIIVFLAVAVVFLLARPYWESPSETAPGLSAEPQAATEGDPPGGTDAGAGKNPAKSVAVLPFVPLSSGEDDEYFADGLTEEILNSLAQLPELLVTARTSSFAFKGQDKPVHEIGSELGVAHIVEGSVRRSGDRLRVTAQLVRADDGFHLWSDNYDRTSADTITVQEDIATEIAEALDVVMDETRREAMRKAGLRNPAAFIAYQRGKAASREAHGAFDQNARLLEANRYFDEVLARVPGYAPALLEHADAYVHIINESATREPTFGGVPEEVIDNAFAIAVNDLDQARRNAANLEQRAAVEYDLAMITGDFHRIRERTEAYLASSHCEQVNWIDPVATIFGYAAELTTRLDDVIACDPLQTVVRFSQARAAMWAGDPDQALELVEAARVRLNHVWLDAVNVQALLSAGQLESAENEITRTSDDGFYEFMGRSKLAAARGDREALEPLLVQARESMPNGNIGQFAELQTYAVFGERETANRIASEIDGRTFGPLPLVLVTMWCACGAPFDLEATPNFAASLEQGDLPWPPASPITFPLKDW